MVALITVVLISGLILISLGAFLTPKLNEWFDNYAYTRYIPAVSVSASLDGGCKYSEENLKSIDIDKEFYLRFEVSVKMKGDYKKDKPVSFFITSPQDRFNFMYLTDYLYKCPEGKVINGKFQYECKAMASRHPIKNIIIFKCKIRSSNSRVCQFTVNFDDSIDNDYSKTFSLDFNKKVSKVKSNKTKVIILR